MQCPQISAPSPSKIQYEVNSALLTSSKRRRLVSAVWNDFKRVEVDGEHRAICKHCHKSFSGSSKSGTTHLKNHLSRCSATQSGESSKRRRLVSKVWNDFERVEVNGERRALCKHCHKDFSGSSKSGTTHLKNHLLRCSAIKFSTLRKIAIPMSTSTSNSAFSIETTTINPILNGLNLDIVEASVCGKEWLDNPIRITSNRDNEHSPEITQNSFVSAEASLSLEPQQKHAPMVANLTSTLCPELAGPTGHSSYFSARTFSSLELHEKHAPFSANTQLMLANLSSISCSEPLPTDRTSFISIGASLSLESQEKLAPLSANSELMLANHSSTSCPWPLATGHTSFVSEHAPSSDNSELMLANHRSTSCPEPLPTGQSSFVSAGTSLSLEAQEKHAPSSANMDLMLENLRPTMYQNHHPPSLFDEVWRLKNIGKDGALHKHLSCEGINTVKDFLILLFIDPARLQNKHSLGKMLLVHHWDTDILMLACVLESGTAYISVEHALTWLDKHPNSSFIETWIPLGHILGTGMSAKMWEVTVEHAQTCVLEKRMFLYSPPSSQQKNGVVFNVVGQVMGLLSECQYVPIDKLSETEKADAHKFVISAFEHWGEVVSFDDEASLVGSSSHLTNVYTASLPRTESSKVFGTGRPAKTWKVTVESAQTSILEKRMFLYSRPPSSPDIISSIYSVGGSSGFDDYDLPCIDRMGLRCEPALIFPEPIKHALDDHDLNFFDTDLI